MKSAYTFLLTLENFFDTNKRPELKAEKSKVQQEQEQAEQQQH